MINIMHMFFYNNWWLFGALIIASESLFYLSRFVPNSLARDLATIVSCILFVVSIVIYPNPLWIICVAYILLGFVTDNKNNKSISSAKSLSILVLSIGAGIGFWMVFNNLFSSLILLNLYAVWLLDRSIFGLGRYRFNLRRTSVRPESADEDANPEVSRTYNQSGGQQLSSQSNKNVSSIQAKSLPTISILIPARNEGKVLEDSVNNALASDYPKMEVIVLDDCSSDRTPEIIRQLAHQGVRFVSGDEPESNWVGKNSALQKLCDEASGDWLVYMDVDTSVEADTVTKLILLAQESDVGMLSVWPQKIHSDILSTLLEPAQFELQNVSSFMLPDQLPVSGRFWLIKRSALESMGGFRAFKSKVLPEIVIAKYLKNRDGYKFVISNSDLGLTYRKRPSSNYDTSIRILYPLMGRSVTRVFAYTMLYGLVYTASVMALWLGGWYLVLFATFYLIRVLAKVSIDDKIYPKSVFLAPIQVVLALINPILANISMFKYEFGRVDWRGRPTCYPVLVSFTPRDKPK